MSLFAKPICSEFRVLWNGAAQWLRGAWRWFVPVQLLVLGLIWGVLHRFDHELLDRLRAGVSLQSTATRAAQQISEWGDFDRWNVMLIAGLLLASWLTKRPALQRLAVLVLMSSASTGLVAVVVRTLTGRARPLADVTDGFYGPNLSAKMQSCPSGHTATAFGLAIPLLIAAPRLGWPSLVMAGAVAWARMYLGRHYPSDVLTSVWLAVWIGIPLAFAATASGDKGCRNTCR